MPALSLALANKNTWLVLPEDKGARFFVEQLAGIMKLKTIRIPGSRGDFVPVASLAAELRASEVSGASSPSAPTKWLIISTGAAEIGTKPDIRWSDFGLSPINDNGLTKELDFRRHPASLESVDTINCRLRSFVNEDMLGIQLQHLSFSFSLEAERGGGVLIHGALAEFHGHGVILAGHGGVGKTTAVGRLPWPWRSLCDDTTLVVKDARGGYWAHPWPTWSSFLFGGNGGSWDVQYAVPLAGIFFLNQALEERIEPLKPVAAACLLNESAEQAFISALVHMTPEAVRTHRLRRLDSIVSLAKSIPVFQLHLSVNGAFWPELEKVLERSHEVVP